jgi:hypothetical protein
VKDVHRRSVASRNWLKLRDRRKPIYLLPTSSLGPIQGQSVQNYTPHKLYKTTPHTKCTNLHPAQKCTKLHPVQSVQIYTPYKLYKSTPRTKVYKTTHRTKCTNLHPAQKCTKLHPVQGVQNYTTHNRQPTKKLYA